jgi:hypothetical protein
LQIEIVSREHPGNAWSVDSKRPIELITSIPVTTADQTFEVIVNHLSRWSVEETHRFNKAGAGLEEMRLFSFDKLKNRIRGSFLTVSLVARMSKYTSWQRPFSRVALRLKKLRQICTTGHIRAQTLFLIY